MKGAFKQTVPSGRFYPTIEPAIPCRVNRHTPKFGIRANGFVFCNWLVYRSGFANPDRAGRERAEYGNTTLIQTNRGLTCPERTCNELYYYEPNDALTRNRILI